MVIEYSVLHQFKPFILGYCNCGCGENLKNLKNKEGKIIKYIQYHSIKKLRYSRRLASTYKNGRIIRSGYRKLLIPNYISSDKQGYVNEHVYIYEQYHKCCMLKWGDVHHINKNKLDNKISNLQGMMHSKHIKFHMEGNNYGKKNINGRLCSKCGSTKTYITKRGCHHWLKDGKNRWLCIKCWRSNNKV